MNNVLNVKEMLKVDKVERFASGSNPKQTLLQKNRFHLVFKLAFSLGVVVFIVAVSDRTKSKEDAAVWLSRCPQSAGYKTRCVEL